MIKNAVIAKQTDDAMAAKNAVIARLSEVRSKQSGDREIASLLSVARNDNPHV